METKTLVEIDLEKLKNLFVVCDAYARFATGTLGHFSPAIQDAVTFSGPAGARRFAKQSARRIGDTVCVIRDYGLESQEIVVTFDAAGKPAAEERRAFGRADSRRTHR